MKWLRTLSLLSFCAAAWLVPAAAQTDNPAEAAKNAATVRMKDSAFKPETLHVRTGDTVEFVNDDGFGHTVTAADGSFDSKDIAGGKTWRYTFSKAGTYALVCTYHSWMKASVVVTDPPSH